MLNSIINNTGSQFGHNAGRSLESINSMQSCAWQKFSNIWNPWKMNHNITRDQCANNITSDQCAILSYDRRFYIVSTIHWSGGGLQRFVYSCEKTPNAILNVLSTDQWITHHPITHSVSTWCTTLYLLYPPVYRYVIQLKLYYCTALVLNSNTFVQFMSLQRRANAFDAFLFLWSI